MNAISCLTLNPTLYRILYQTVLQCVNSCVFCPVRGWTSSIANRCFVWRFLSILEEIAQGPLAGCEQQQSKGSKKNVMHLVLQRSVILYIPSTSNPLIPGYLRNAYFKKGERVRNSFVPLSTPILDHRKRNFSKTLNWKSRRFVLKWNENFSCVLIAILRDVNGGRIIIDLLF